MYLVAYMPHHTLSELFCNRSNGKADSCKRMAEVKIGCWVFALCSIVYIASTSGHQVYLVCYVRLNCEIYIWTTSCGYWYTQVRWNTSNFLEKPDKYQRLLLQTSVTIVLDICNDRLRYLSVSFQISQKTITFMGQCYSAYFPFIFRLLVGTLFALFS